MLNVTPKRRKRSPPLTITDLEKARHTCAVLIQRDKEGNRKLIPLFERIENEIKKIKHEQILMERICQIALDSKYKITDA